MEYLEQRKLADIGNREPACVTGAEPLRAILALLRARPISCVVVTQGRRPVGIFTERDALALVASGDGRSMRPVSEAMTTAPLCCPADLGYLDGYSRMARQGVRHLVLVNPAGEVAGVVTESDFVAALALEDHLRPRTVAEVMVRAPAVLAPAAPLRDALTLMLERRVSSVVAVRDGRPVGILSERDVCRIDADGEALDRLALEAVMTTSVPTCAADESLAAAADRMQAAGVRRLPVVDADDLLVGIVSRHDLVKLLRDRPVHQDEQRFTRLFDAAPLAMVLTRLADEVILNANPAAGALSGYAVAELIGRTSGELHAWGETAERARYLGELRAGRRVRARRVCLRRKDGSTLSIEVHGERVTLGGTDCALSMFVDVTPQLDYLRQIEHQHRLLAAVFEAIGDALILTDAGHRILLANSAVQRIFGHAPEAVLGRPAGPLFADAGTLEQLEQGAGAAPAAPGNGATAQGRRADGSVFPAELGLSPVCDADGDTIGRALLVRDISERERRRQELAEQQARLQGLIDTMADWVWEIDADARYTFASEQVRQVLGYAPEALIGITPFDLMPPHEAGRVAAELATITAAGEPFRDLVNTRLSAAGEPRIMAMSGVPIRGPDGGIRGWRGIDRDITDARRAAERVRASEAQLRAIFDHANVGIALLTGYRVIARANRRLAEILGYADPAELEGASVRRLHLSETSFAEFGQRRYEQLRRREQLHVEYELRRQDGSAVWCLLSGAAVDPTQPADLALGVIWTVEDISGIKEQELALRSLNARLVEEHELFTSGPTMVFRWRPDPGWPVAQCSPNAGQRLALPTDDPGVEFPFEGLIHPDDRKRVVAEVAAFTAQGVEGFEQEYRLRGAFGDWRHVYDYTRVRRDDAGTVLAYHGYLVDITERRLAAEALRESEARHRTLFESAGQPMLTLDTDGHITAANRAACELLGCNDAGRLLGLTAAAFSPRHQPDGTASADKAAALLREALDSGRVRFEWEHHRRDRSPLPVDVTLTRVELHGQPALLATWYDLSDRRRAAELEQRATAVFENTTEGIMLTDADNRIVAVNPAFTEITGYSAEEAVGERPTLLHSGRQDRDFYRGLWQQLNATGSWRGEIWNRRKDGEIYAEWLSISEIRDADGTLRHHIGVFSDITRMRRSEEEIDQLTHYDPVTGLPNQRLLRARLEQALQSAEVAGRPLALMLLNLDGFRRIVASFGHEAADAVLAAVGARLAKRLPADAILARTVGDTFAVAVELEHADASPSRRAVLLQEAVRKRQAVPGVGELTLGCCIGVALSPTDATTGPELLRDADTALQRAKQAGPGSIAYYRPELTTAALHQLEMERTLRTALAANQFQLYFQPKLDLGCRCVVGAEALIRWRRPDGVIVPPDAFMGVAEVSDLALDLDRWVLGEAVDTLLRWQRAELPRARVSVNVSAAMLTGGALAASVEAVLAETGLDPTLLEIEVLENILIEDPDRAEAELAAVGALGVGIALDDFGTGYASLGYLKRFAFDYLKIDRGFIAGLTTSADDMAIVRATILMAHHLGIRVVAEGVEEDAQIRELAALDCDLLQGYRIGKPMPAADFAALLTGDAGPIADGLRAALQPRALLVGDDDIQLGRIATQLGHLGWQGLRATGAAAAQRLLQEEPLDLVLCDQVLADGAVGDLLDWLRRHRPALTRLLLLEHADPALLMDAVNRGGIFRCLQKPCGNTDLAEALQAGYEHRLRKVRAEPTGTLVAR